jgi:hypothetical protein
MNQPASYRILTLGLRVGLSIVLSAGLAMAQQPRRAPKDVDVYCSGVATDQTVPTDAYLISGEDSSYRNTYSQGENVYLNRGAEQGVKVGDEFEVIRPAHDILTSKWFKWQAQLSRAMGTVYSDIGRVRVINVQAKTSIAKVNLACNLLQRGDLVRPFVTRPVPAYHEAKFDQFAPPSGKKTAMVVTTKNFGQISAVGQVIYINLGSGQGVQVGDYIRVFRYQGTRSELLYQIQGTAYKVYGFGSTPVAYTWDNLPRQVVGEGIVLRTGPNSATVLVTAARQEIFDGDYVEIE